jgi:hypothetical protein
MSYCAVVEIKPERLVDIGQEADFKEGVMETFILIYKADEIEYYPSLSWEGTPHSTQG